eukprot:TRINITY_DN6271_c0_g2_i2.p1 TRINITY_DN6271_c0_g2~~TRINITY_DN6271_c0_g2_i2.p1  ORF type:complete len:374 (+),score=70.21 TRINITY_DN6271_c0_g2_i2:145-1266(+)
MQGKGHWIVDTPIANPMSKYPQYKANRTTWGINALGTVVVEVELEDGTVGIGASIGGEPACYIIENHFSRFVEKQDPRDVELIWDQMYRASLPYGRKGLGIHAISAVDLALWDCIGKVRREPIYALLGGKTQPRLPVYATTVRPDLAKEFGFWGAKVPLPWGPADGAEGLKKNIDFLRECRRQVGDGFPLMIDCYMSLTLEYSTTLLKHLQPLDIYWLEEALPPDDYDGYAELRRRAPHYGSTMITTGEHEYTRYGFRQLLTRQAADVLQPDVTWVGGLTECRRIVALASAFDVPVIPHGSSVFSYHMQLAFPSCPRAEYLVMSPKADKLVGVFGELFESEPLPNKGFLDVPDSPGWGVKLNSNLKLTRPYKH